MAGPHQSALLEEMLSWLRPDVGELVRAQLSENESYATWLENIFECAGDAGVGGVREKFERDVGNVAHFPTALCELEVATALTEYFQPVRLLSQRAFGDGLTSADIEVDTGENTVLVDVRRLQDDQMLATACEAVNKFLQAGPAGFAVDVVVSRYFMLPTVMGKARVPKQALFSEDVQRLREAWDANPGVDAVGREMRLRIVAQHDGPSCVRLVDAEGAAAVPMDEIACAVRIRLKELALKRAKFPEPHASRPFVPVIYADTPWRLDSALHDVWYGRQPPSAPGDLPRTYSVGVDALVSDAVMRRVSGVGWMRKSRLGFLPNPIPDPEVALPEWERNLPAVASPFGAIPSDGSLLI